jgi:Major Facilitator Superfamily
VGWTALGYLPPLYPLYALLFLSTGVSEQQVSGLFALWSAVGFLAEVPAGVLADRWSRRGALVLGSVLEAAGFALWTALPGLPGYAAGFALWGLGGALQSGAAEALVYDGLAAAGGAGCYARVHGWLSATEVLAALPAAGLATALYAAGGFALVGWASVGVCLLTAGVATGLPEPPRTGGGADDDGGGWQEARTALRHPPLRLLLAAVALVAGVDAVEEYVPVLAGTWGVPTAAVPVVVVAVPLAGALGAVLGGRAARLRGGALAGLLALAGVLLGIAALWARPAALAAVAACYALYLAVLVAAGARLQDRIAGRSRATLTSVSALGTELTSLLVFGTWALSGALGTAGLVLAAAPVLAAALSDRGARPRRPPRWRRGAPPSPAGPAAGPAPRRRRTPR